MQIPCLQCKSKDTRTVSSLARLEIVKLWSLFDRAIQDSVLLRCNSPEQVELLECHACGFQFFDSKQAAAGLFYQHLVVVNRPRHPYPGQRVRLLSLIYRKLGMKYFVTNRGLSTYAFFGNS